MFAAGCFFNAIRPGSKRAATVEHPESLQMRRGIVALVICMILVAGCGDPGVEMHFENPCDQPVEFIFQLVDRGTVTPFGPADVLMVAAHGAGVLAPLVIDFDDGTEALITIVGRAGVADLHIRSVAVW